MRNPGHAIVVQPLQDQQFHKFGPLLLYLSSSEDKLRLYNIQLDNKHLDLHMFKLERKKKKTYIF